MIRVSEFLRIYGVTVTTAVGLEQVTRDNCLLPDRSTGIQALGLIMSNIYKINQIQPYIKIMSEIQIFKLKFN